MRRVIAVVLLFSSLACVESAFGGFDAGEMMAVTSGDFKAFYLDDATMGSLGVGVFGAGLLANSAADREAREFIRDDIRSSATDSISDVARLPGDVVVAVPLVFGVYALTGDGPVRDWSEKTLRAYAVGAPVGLFLQYATGASRPEEGPSKWRPWKGNNGLSGHSFIGAVPFITAARMQEKPAMKALFYGLSAMPALSRMNDEKHYLSQSALGWWLAYLSASAVDARRAQGSSWRLSPFAGGPGLVISSTF